MSLALALAAVTLLGTRLISSPDIGYHLVYGHRFFKTLHPVESSPHIYTVSDKPLTEPEELPPCAWRDRQGRFCFPNANWLTQILFAAVYTVWGFTGLSVLGALLVLTAGGFSAAAMRRDGIHPAVAAVAILLIGFGAFERFLLRPEMVSFAILSVQIYLLTAFRSEKKGGAFYIAALALSQLLFVNAHSYWILGLFLSAAFLIGDFLQRPRRKDFQPGRDAPIKKMALLFILQAGVTLINPWTWRLALLPLKTGIFFFKNQISSHSLTGHPWADYFLGGHHPWSVISEFFPTFHTGFTHSVATWAFIFILIISAAGALTALIKKEWRAVILLAGISCFSLTMRRNIAPAAFIMVPVSLMALSNIFKQPLKQRTNGFAALFFIASIPVVIINLWLVWTIPSNRFYAAGNYPYRFGIGPSRVELPLGACDFLSRAKPPGHIWTDFESSSSVRFFTTPHPDLPILTNTWVMPVSVMDEVFRVTSEHIPLEQAFTRHGFHTAVLKITPVTAIPFPGRKTIPMALAMSMDSRWDLVYLDVMHAVYVRNTGENRSFADRYRIDIDERWLAGYIDMLKNVDPVPAAGLLSGAFTLKALGYDKAFTAVYDAARKTAGFDMLKKYGTAKPDQGPRSVVRHSATR